MPARGGRWGGGAALVLVAGACLSAWLGVRGGVPLLDGLAPPPLYRWVTPPAELRGLNKPPNSVTQDITVSGTATPATDVSTADGQVEVSLPEGALPALPGQSGVRLAISPVDPASIPAPPAGVTIQGNAYRIDLASEPGGTPVTATLDVPVALRYPVDATQVLQLSGGAWQLVTTTLESSAEAVVGFTRPPGVFAAALIGAAPAKPARAPAWAFLAAGLALLVAAIPLAIRRPKAAGVGLLLAAVYLGAAGLTFRTNLLAGAPVLDDGTPVSPYQWVSPPPDRVRDNKPPGVGGGSVPLPVEGAPSVSTPEGQAQVLFETTSVPAAPGQTSVSVTLTPLDPETVSSPPAGLQYYSDAYAVTATYQPSGAPLPGLSVTMALISSSLSGDRILQQAGPVWSTLPTTTAPQSLQAYAPATSLGTFVVAGPAGGTSATQPSTLRLLLFIAVPFLIIFLAVGAVLTHRRR